MPKKTAIADDDSHGKCSECGRCKCCDKQVVFYPSYPYQPYVVTPTYPRPYVTYSGSTTSISSGTYTA